MIPAALPYQYLHHFDRHDRDHRNERSLTVTATTPRYRSARAIDPHPTRPAKLWGTAA